MAIPELRQLASLLEVAAHGSISRAAEALFVSQSAVSQQIGALEREYGCALFVRGRQGVEPTEAGRALIEHARRILAAVGAAEDELSGLAAPRGTRLRLGSSAGPMVRWLPEVLPSLARRHGELSFSLTLGSSAAICVRVLRGGLDVGICNLPVPPGLGVRTLYEDRVEVLLPAAHALAAPAEVQLAALRDISLVTLPRGHPARDAFTAACARAGFRPNVMLETDNAELIREFAARALAVAVVPSLLVRHVAGDRLTTRPLAGPPLVRRLAVVTRGPEPLRPVVAEFVRLLSDHVARSEPAGQPAAP